MRIIDAHCHIFPPEILAARQQISSREAWFASLYQNPKEKMSTADDLLQSMEKARVNQSVIFGFAFDDPGLCHTCNEYILHVARQNPTKFLPFAVVQARSGAAATNEVLDCANAGALGVGELLPDGQGYSADDWHTLNPLMECIRTLQCPVMFHLNEQVGHRYPGKGSQGPVAGYHLGKQYPDIKFIFSHWGGGLPFYELMPEVCEALQNVYYDTAASPFLYDDRIYSSCLDWMPNKILWGSDYPLLGQKRFLKRLQALHISKGKMEQLLWQNTASLLGLESQVVEEDA